MIKLSSHTNKGLEFTKILSSVVRIFEKEKLSPIFVDWVQNDAKTRKKK